MIILRGVNIYVEFVRKANDANEIEKRFKTRKTDQGSHKKKKHRAQAETFLNENQNEKRKSPYS